MALTEQNAI